MLSRVEGTPVVVRILLDLEDWADTNLSKTFHQPGKDIRLNCMVKLDVNFLEEITLGW